MDAATTSTLPHLRDVSNWQGPVDWHLEHRETVGCMVKVSQGLTYIDPTARRRVRNATYAKVRTGGYHFATPGVGSGEQQVDRLLRFSPLQPGWNFRPVLDCEANPLRLNSHQLAVWHLAAVLRVKHRTGYWPTIYGPPDYLQSWATIHPEVFGRCPLWVANYGVAHPRVPAPWHSWAAWQWTSGWHDPALPRDRRVDDSYVADLAALIIPRTAAAARIYLAGGRPALAA